MQQTSKSLISTFVVCIVLLIFGMGFLQGQEHEETTVIRHDPVISFNHGDVISISAAVLGEVDWVRFNFRYEGLEEFQVRELTIGESGFYLFEYDTSQLPELGFEYYISAEIGETRYFLPSDAPGESFTVSGMSEEEMPEIPQDFPSPQEESRGFRFKLPVSVSANIQQKVYESEDTQNVKTIASGNIRVFTNYSKEKFHVDIDSNFNYTNTPFEGEKNLDLSNMVLTVSQGYHLLRGGDININESEFTVAGLGRRGLEYVFQNQKAYVHFFNVNTQEPLGFKGFGIPKKDISVIGGAAQYKFFNETMALKAVYLTGQDDPALATNIGYAPYYQSRKGDVLSLANETNLFKNHVHLRAEIAQSRYDEDLIDEQASKTDMAWKVGGDFAYGVVNGGANYKYVGREFTPIGYQYFTNDRKGFDSNVGLNVGRLSIMGSYASSGDNVENNPDEYTTKNQNANLNLMWNVSNKISINLNVRRDKQNTSSTSEFILFNQDSLTNQVQASVNLNLSQSVSFNTSASGAFQSSKNNPQMDNDNLALNLGGNFRLGMFFSFMPSVGYSQMKNKFSGDIMNTLNSFFSLELNFFPRVFTTSFSGSYMKNDGRDMSSENMSLSGSLNFFLSELVRLGNISMALRGDYNQSKMTGYSDSFFSAMFQLDFSF